MLVICVVSLVTIFFLVAAFTSKWNRHSASCNCQPGSSSISPCCDYSTFANSSWSIRLHRERQRPAREYKILVMLVSLSGFLCCLGYCTSLFLACICLVGARIAGKMVSVILRILLLSRLGTQLCGSAFCLIGVGVPEKALKCSFFPPRIL